MSSTTQGSRVHLLWDLSCEDKTVIIIDKILDEINDVYSLVSRLNPNEFSVYSTYKLIEIGLYRHLVNLRNIQFLHRLSNCDVGEDSFSEFPSDFFIYKILYSSLERSDVFLALLKFHRNQRSPMCPPLERWITKMLSLGRRFCIEGSEEDSLE